jgi:hypothetical protein
MACYGDNFTFSQVQEAVCENVAWIYLAEDRVQWRIFSPAFGIETT